MTEEKNNLLIVEDDLDVAEMLTAYFRVQGYDVQTVNWGEDGLRACETSQPDLVILDIRLPDIDGYEVARRLRANRRTQDIPIIFLTDKRQRVDRLQGLEIGADDYITKPFDVQELRLRVRNALRRVSQGSLTNPVTSLPERGLVDERLRECLEDDTWAILVVSVHHLDSFRESYGFVASDDAVRAVSLMIQNAVREEGSPQDFVGQLAPSAFVVVTTEEYLGALRDRISRRLDQTLDYFYPVRDREKGIEPEKRLDVRLGQLLPEAGPFNDLDHLKTALLRRGS